MVNHDVIEESIQIVDLPDIQKDRNI